MGDGIVNWYYASPSHPAIILTWTVLGLAMLTLVIPANRRLARQIFAVAVLGFREGLRLKVLWTVAALALIPGLLAYFSDADGTHAGRASLILNYCLSTGELLGAMLIVLLSALSVAHEIESRIMHTLGTKPVPRWAILFGKALGFWAIDLAFLLGLTLFAAVLVRLVPTRPETRSSGALSTTGTWDDLRRNALTTREYEAPDEVGGGEKMKMIKPGHAFTWRFDIDPRKTSEAIAIRFQISSTQTFASHVDNLGIRIGYDGPAMPIYDQKLKVPQDRPFNLYIEQKDMPGAGTLAITLTAPETRNAPSVVATARMGLADDGLTQNLAKAALLMALQGWILAVITTSWSGVLSFPVTVAMGLILVLGGEMSRHALELMTVSVSSVQDIGGDTARSALQQGVSDQLRILLRLLPDFQAAGGPTVFVDGQRLSGWAVADAILMMGLVRGVGWALPGIYLFQRREVGR